MFTILGADGKEYGPVPAAKIHEWLNGGRANYQTRARRDGDTDWKTLGDFPEFAGAPVASVAPIAIAPATAAVTLVPGTPLASRWLRLGAYLLDALIGCAAATPGLVLMFMAGAFTDMETAQGATLIAGFGALAVCLLALLAFQIYLLATVGQTLGKKIVGVRIVNFDDEGNPGFVKAFLLRSFVNGLISGIPVIGGIYSLVDICFIFRDDKRCIHDLIANTKVVVA